jgi:hypothetical protein
MLAIGIQVFRCSGADKVNDKLAFEVAGPNT